MGCLLSLIFTNSNQLVDTVRDFAKVASALLKAYVGKLAWEALAPLYRPQLLGRSWLGALGMNAS